jgi:hypothetical protein
MTTINATANKKTYKGQSGSGHAIGILLKNSQNADAKKFIGYLAGLKEKNGTGRSPFSCAEPHAVALALRAGASLDDIRLDFEAKEKSREIEYCSNCVNWINRDDGSLKVELIRGSEPIAPELSTRSINLSTLVDQALEKSGKKPTPAASPSGWGTKNWATHFTANDASKSSQTYAEAFPPLGMK